MLNMMNMFVLIAYLLVLLGISIVANKYSKSHSSFLLGGRSLNSFTAAISACAADMSAWLLLGLPGAIYISGFNNVWMPIGLLIGSFLNWHFTAFKLREKSSALKAITIPDFLSKVTNEQGKSIRVIASIMIVIFFTMYVASGFVSGAKTFTEYFGFSYHTGLFLTAIVIIICTIVGGFLAISWGELFQGLIMVAVIVAIPILATLRLDELQGGVVDRALAYNPNMFDMLHNTGLMASLFLAAWGLGYFGQPHILAKFMALKGTYAAQKAKYISLTWMLLSLSFAVFIGIFGAAIFLDSPLQDPELVLIALATTLLHPAFMGIVIIAILSAIFSTANAQLLIVSSVFTNDLKIVRSTVTMNRIIIVLVGVGAILLGWDSNSRILEMVGYAWAGFGACFGPIIILSLNMKNSIHSLAGTCGILVGGFIVILWNILRSMLPNVEFLQWYELFPAFALSFITILLVNAILKNNKKVELAK